MLPRPSGVITDGMPRRYARRNGVRFGRRALQESVAGSLGFKRVVA